MPRKSLSLRISLISLGSDIRTDSITMSAVFFRARITIRIFYNEILVGIHTSHFNNGLILQIIFVLYTIYNAMGNINSPAYSINVYLFY
jgi:hypothetical protein